jgi:MFS family permease
MYMLTSTISIPVSGKLADIYGRRRVYMIGMALILLGSALNRSLSSQLSR